MPIEGVSELVRIPRLGKIHLGVKVKPDDKNKKEYPKATDHFVVPDEVAEIYGPKPTELQIMFPVEEPELFAQQWLRAYSLTQGLVCIGTGVDARRKMDVATGAMADHETKDWEWREMSCDPQECQEYQTKRCRRVMNLQFLLPEVPGLGVYQIDTSSFYSIVNINSMIKMLKGILGRCSMIPLTLALGPIDVFPPGQTKKTVHIMHIKKDIKLAQLAHLAQLPPAKVLIPEADTAEPPEDLFPEGIIGESTKTTTATKRTRATKQTKETEGKKSPEDKDLFPEEEELDIPWTEDDLMRGWQIVKGTVHRLNLTDSQIQRWFAHYNIELKLADFDKITPPEGLKNDLLSKFEDMLTAYEEKQKVNAAEQEER